MPIKTEEVVRGHDGWQETEKGNGVNHRPDRAMMDDQAIS